VTSFPLWLLCPRKKSSVGTWVATKAGRVSLQKYPIPAINRTSLVLSITCMKKMDIKILFGYLAFSIVIS
jgi:hypothetical protein